MYSLLDRFLFLYFGSSAFSMLSFVHYHFGDILVESDTFMYLAATCFEVPDEEKISTRNLQ